MDENIREINTKITKEMNEYFEMNSIFKSIEYKENPNQTIEERIQEAEGIFDEINEYLPMIKRVALKTKQITKMVEELFERIKVIHLNNVTIENEYKRKNNEVVRKIIELEKIKCKEEIKKNPNNRKEIEETSENNEKEWERKIVKEIECEETKKKRKRELLEKGNWGSVQSINGREKIKRLFRIGLIGDQFTGTKTSYLYKLVDDVFSERTPQTTGVDIKITSVNIHNNQMTVLIWDTAGAERFRNDSIPYYQYCDGFIIGYDITNRESFDHLNKWFDEVEKNTSKKSLKIVIGNKIDNEIDREVTTEEGRLFAEKNGCSFFETSAKDGTNIQESFKELMTKVFESFEEEAIEEEIKSGKVVKKGKCGGNILEYFVYQNGGMIIEGKGDMNVYDDNSFFSSTPFKKEKENIKKIIIKEGVTSIGNGCFTNCKNLLEINIPTTVTSIGSQSLSECSNLIEINIPSSVTDIGIECFKGCKELEGYITIDSNNPIYKTDGRKIYKKDNEEEINVW